MPDIDCLSKECTARTTHHPMKVTPTKGSKDPDDSSITYERVQLMRKREGGYAEDLGVHILGVWRYRGQTLSHAASCSSELQLIDAMMVNLGGRIWRLEVNPSGDCPTRRITLPASVGDPFGRCECCKQPLPPQS